MKSNSRILPFCAALAFALAITGCASRNVNPPLALSGKGYVDFYVDVSVPLSWEITEINPTSQKTKTLFSDFTPLDGRILRLAFSPGPHQFEITYLNRAIATPARAEVRVREGRIVPVQILYTPVSEVEVERVDESLKRSIRGTVVRGGVGSLYPSRVYDLSTDVKESVFYQTKENMPYYAEQPGVAPTP